MRLWIARVVSGARVGGGVARNSESRGHVRGVLGANGVSVWNAAPASNVISLPRSITTSSIYCEAAAAVAPAVKPAKPKASGSKKSGGSVKSSNAGKASSSTKQSRGTLKSKGSAQSAGSKEADSPKGSSKEVEAKVEKAKDKKVKAKKVKAKEVKAKKVKAKKVAAPTEKTAVGSMKESTKLKTKKKVLKRPTRVAPVKGMYVVKKRAHFLDTPKVANREDILAALKKYAIDHQLEVSKGKNSEMIALDGTLQKLCETKSEQLALKAPAFYAFVETPTKKAHMRRVNSSLKARRKAVSEKVVAKQKENGTGLFAKYAVKSPYKELLQSLGAPLESLATRPEVLRAVYAVLRNPAHASREKQEGGVRGLLYSLKSKPARELLGGVSTIPFNGVAKAVSSMIGERSK